MTPRMMPIYRPPDAVLISMLYMLITWGTGTVCESEVDCSTFHHWSDHRRLQLAVQAMDELIPEEVYNFILGGSLCTVSVTDIYSEMLSTLKTDQRKKFRVRLIIHCVNSLLVAFDATELDPSPEVFSLIIDVSFSGPCITTDEALSSLSKAGNISMVMFMDDSSLTIGKTENCDFAKEIQILRMSSFIQLKPMNSVFDVCPEVFPTVIDLALYYASPSAMVYPNILETKFPNVQSLEINNVGLNSTLRFPWNSISKMEGTLPCCNIRFSYISSYRRRINLEIPFQFCGDIHVVKISGVNAESIQANLFSNNTSLRDLDLSSNGLIQIHKLWFENQSKLFRLLLSHNSINSISVDTFNDLISLEYLDLSYNRLLSLDIDLLATLRSLKQIHLEYNNLYHIPVGLFLGQVNIIEAIFVHSNPLEDIPIEPVYAPFLEILDLHNTSINNESIRRFIVNIDGPDLALEQTVRFRLDGYKLEATESGLKTRTIDLSFCNIASLPLFGDYGVIINQRVAEFTTLLSYNLELEGNPLHCGCHTYALQYILAGVSSRTHVPNFDAWKCETPAELRGRPFLSVQKKEMLCPSNETNCPLLCLCSSRVDRSSFVVDCRKTTLSAMPKQMPSVAHLELWFQSSEIEQLATRDYYSNVSVLDLSFSKVSFIDPVIFAQFKIIEVLRLDSNLVSTLPPQLMDTNVTQLFISNNPLLCDCRLVWLKKWLLSSSSSVMDTEHVKCTVGSQKGKRVIDVQDAMFICREEEFSHMQHVVMPSLVIGVAIFVVVVVSLLVFFQRLVVKVLLYVYCGLHPFDKDEANDKENIYDAFAIYGFERRGFMQGHVVNYLKGKGYKVADIYKDFIIGETFTKNVELFARNSRRIIIFLQEEPFKDELIRYTWNLAYETTLNWRTNYIILILDSPCSYKFERKNDQHSSLNMFLKHRCFINKDSALFSNCLDYLMPKLHNTHNDNNRGRDTNEVDSVNAIEMTTREIDRTTFVTYPDELDEEIRHELIPYLNDRGHNIKVFEFEYVPGAWVGEQIVDIIERSRRLVYILSESVLNDERKTLILKNAIAKTMDCANNYLLLFTYGRIHVGNLTSDIRAYLDTHVTIRIEDDDFRRRLLQALSVDSTRFRYEEQFEQVETDVTEEMRLPLV